MKFILILCLVGVIIGCVSIHISKLNTELKYPPVNPKDVAVYKSNGEIYGVYEKVALLTASGDSNLMNSDSLIEVMKQKAGELGANGILLSGTNSNRLDNANMGNADSVNKVDLTIIGADTQRQYQATAIQVIHSWIW